MKRRSLRSLVAPAALLFAGPACAQQPAASAAHLKDADPALWMVRDHDTTIYLFGTIHVLKPGLSWFDEAVKTAFDKSDQVVLELVMPDPAAMQSLVLAKGMTQGGPTLTEQLPVAKRAAYARALARMGVPAAAFDRMRPWFAATNLSLLPLMKSGYDAANGPEQVITAAAKADGKPVIGLETAEQQLGYFAGLSQRAQIAFLTSTVDELPGAGKQMTAMVDEWARGDPDALARDMNDDLKASPEVARVLLFQRNARWADWIKARMAKPGTLFIAVGAGHLAGPQSVQTMLAKRGLKVTRVRY